MIHNSYLIMMIRYSTHTVHFTSITRELIERIDLIIDTHSTECTWQAFLEVQYFHIHLHNDDNEVVWCAIRPTAHDVLGYLRRSQDCRVIKKYNTSFFEIYMKPTAYYGTTTSGTQPWKNMTTMEKSDTSDLIMIIRWVTNIPSGSPKLELPV